MNAEVKTLAPLPESQTVMAVFTKGNGLDPYIAQVKDKVAELMAEAGPVDTLEGRTYIKSVNRKVASFKSAIEKLGKDLAKDLKDLPKKVDAERSRAWEIFEKIQSEIMQPVEEWEAEEKRKAEEEVARIEAEKLREKIENDHEFALFMNEAFDKKKADEAAAAEAARIARENEIADRAAEVARKNAEAEAQRKIAQEKAVFELKERQAREAVEAAERAKLKAEQDAENARLKAIRDAEIAKQEADRRQAAAIEAERQRVAAEEKAKADEIARREANIAHRRKVNNAILNCLAQCGVSEEVGKEIIKMAVEKRIPNLSINY